MKAHREDTPPADEMYYAELPCDPDLRDWISSHWVFAVAPTLAEVEHLVPLTGGPMICLDDQGMKLFVGPRSTPLTTTLRGGSVIWGTHVWPWATRSLFGNPEPLLESVLPLERVLTEEDSALAGEAVQAHTPGQVVAGLDCLWLRVVGRAESPDPDVARAALFSFLRFGAATVTELAAVAGLSSRHFRRRFRTAVGLGPKELARIQRARAASADLVRREGASWADRAAGFGYSDQAHLVREYRRFFDASPRTVEGHLRRIVHGALRA